MDTQIESDLRIALATRAAKLDENAGTRVLARDYKPRGGVPRVALAGGGVAVAATGAVAAILTVGLSTNTPRAFAGWSSTPTSAQAGQTQSAEEACRGRLPASAAIEHAQQTASGPRGPGDIPQITAGGWQTTLTDVRGPYTVLLFTAPDGQAVLSCFSGHNLAEVSLGGALGTQPATAVPVGQIAIRTSGFNTTPPDEGSARFSRIVGRTGSGVTAVSLRLSDGTQVIASVENGWFLAWWPGTTHATAAEVTTTNGTQTQPIGGPFGTASATSSAR